MESSSASARGGVQLPGIWELTVLETKGWQQVAKFGQLGLGVFAFSADGKRLATANWAAVGVMDVQTGQFLLDRLTGKSIVTSVAFSPHARWIATGHQDGDVKLWKIK
jgi:WD40 repeat protein